MTNNTEQQAVPVAQEDREAACATYLRFRYGQPPLYTNIAAGRIDHDPIVQAFARHRLASLPCKSGNRAGATIRAALQAYRSLPAGTVREFPMLEARANDPNDRSHSVLTARLPGLRDEYETAKAKIKDIDAALASLDATQTREAELASRCDGKEQLAFEEWARSQRYDMNEHPLHYLFLDAKTSAARDGWAAGLKYASDIARAALNARGGA